MLSPYIYISFKWIQHTIYLQAVPHKHETLLSIYYWAHLLRSLDFTHEHRQLYSSYKKVQSCKHYMWQPHFACHSFLNLACILSSFTSHSTPSFSRISSRNLEHLKVRWPISPWLPLVSLTPKSWLSVHPTFVRLLPICRGKSCLSTFSSRLTFAALPLLTWEYQV